MKYVEINVNGYNKMYTIGNADVKKKINKFVRDNWSYTQYLTVKTNRGEKLKLHWDDNRTMKHLPSYLEDSVSGEIIEVGERFIGKTYPNRVLHYL